VAAAWEEESAAALSPASTCCISGLVYRGCGFFVSRKDASNTRPGIAYPAHTGTGTLPTAPRFSWFSGLCRGRRRLILTACNETTLVSLGALYLGGGQEDKRYVRRLLL